MGGGVLGVLFSSGCHDDYEMLLEFRRQGTKHPEVCGSVLHDEVLPCPNC